MNATLSLWRDGPDVRAQLTTRATRPPRGWRVVAELFGGEVGHGLLLASPAARWAVARLNLATFAHLAPAALPAEAPAGRGVIEINSLSP